MLYRFFEDTLPSRFIKHLLRVEPIPRFKVIEDDDYLVKDTCYLYQGMIIQCVNEGYFKRLPEDNLYPSDQLYPLNYDPKVYPGINTHNYILGRYKVIKYYDPDDVTTQYNYHSKEMWYDSTTHYHLGEYLRYLKYERHINLLPYYNCFNYRSTVNLEVPRSRKYLLVPVKFNRLYTVALNSELPFKVSAILYNEFLGKYKETPLQNSYINASYNSPFTIRTGTPVFTVGSTEENLATYEKDLHLLFDLTSTNNTGLTVLEGDYTNSNLNVTTGYPHKNSFVNLSLLKVDNNVSYAFSTRLLEYLLLHVICEQDSITDNIARVQKQLVDLNIKQSQFSTDNIFQDYEESLLSGHSTYGLWDEELTAKINIYIRHLVSKGIPLVDQDGNINSQIEEYLRRGVT